MAFTTIGDVYQIHFRVSRKVGNIWIRDNQSGTQKVIATSDRNAVSIVQSFMGQDNTTIRVECFGNVRKVMDNVIIAV